MKKLAYLFAGMAAFGLCSCSSDEPSNPEGNIAKGDVAYLNVNIIATGTGSRATDGGFEYGQANENAVNNAYFYFYDEQGNFVTESNTWANGSTNSNTPTENIEVFGNNTVVLEGLTGKGYPKWVITVLNKPSVMNAKRTITEMAEQLTQWNTGISTGQFVMSTTSYNGTENTPYYFATQLKDTNFSQTPTAGNVTQSNPPVRIYVERLAARVQVSMLGISNTTKVINDKTCYEVPVTIAGAENENSGYDHNGNPIAAEKVYIQVLGWGLNATAKQSSLSKNIEGLNSLSWNATAWADNAWNDATNRRSYWGKSTTYGVVAPGLASLLYVGDKKYAELNLEVGHGRTYCNETTNEIANITTNNVANPNETPTVLLAAKIFDKNGKALSLVNFLGVNFIKDGFLRKALDIKKDQVNPYYYKDGTEYKLFDEKCVDLALTTGDNKGTGAVDVVLKDGVQLYTRTAEGTTYTAITESQKKGLKEALLDVTEGASNKAIAYTDGATFYAIPLEHLNKPTGISQNVVEGQYGVVRNHIYSLDITKISSIGDGVFDIDDELINPEDPKTPNYYVESQINILSWKVVSQEAEI